MNRRNHGEEEEKEATSRESAAHWQRDRIVLAGGQEAKASLRVSIAGTDSTSSKIRGFLLGVFLVAPTSIGALFYTS